MQKYELIYDKCEETKNLHIGEEEYTALNLLLIVQGSNMQVLGS